MALATTTLKTEKREVTGSKACSRIRAAGGLPGIVYGKEGEPLNVTVPTVDFERCLYGGERMIILDIEGDEKTVLIKDVQFDPLMTETLHVDFYSIRMDQVISLNVDVELEGIAVGAKEEGGVVNQELFSIEVECLPLNIPEKVTYDITEMHLEDSAHVSDLPVIEGVTYLNDPDEVVVTIALPREEEEEEPEAAEGEALESLEPEVIGEKDAEEGEEAEAGDEKAE